METKSKLKPKAEDAMQPVPDTGTSRTTPSPEILGEDQSGPLDREVEMSEVRGGWVSM